VIAGAAAFLALFGGPLLGTFRLWWTDPESAHGLLLAPLAVFIAWRQGLGPGRAGRVEALSGLALLVLAVALRYGGGLAAEPYTMRLSALLAGSGLVIWTYGWRQMRRWWLPAGLLFLSLPLPELVVGALSFPLQREASQLGAALLDWRHVPVRLSGNVIDLPGRSLFVTEACSGLRSLSALLALGLLVGGLWLRTAWARGLLLLLAIPIAMALNGLRIFVTGFTVHFISAQAGEGVLHYTEGWVLFVTALLILAGLARLLLLAENLRHADGRALA
jgi:exosortase